MALFRQSVSRGEAVRPFCAGLCGIALTFSAQSQTVTQGFEDWSEATAEVHSLDPVYLRWRKTGDNANPCYLGIDDIAITDPLSGEVDRRQLGPSSRRTMLTLSEVMYHPPTRPDGLNLEFIEICNTDPVFTDISGFRISGEVDYTFPTGTVLQAYGRVVVAANPAALSSVYGLTGILGPYAGTLSNGGGTLRLRNTADAILLELEYNDNWPWPSAAEGAGHSLVLARPDYGENDRRAWSASARCGGTPGAPEAWDTDPLTRIVINEFMAHTDLPQKDFIELYNQGPHAASLSGCVLTDDPASNAFTIPPGTILQPGSTVSFGQDTLGFSLSMQGDSIYLVHTNADRVLDAVRFGAQANGITAGRYPDGGGELRVLSSPSRGSPNSAPAAPDVVINEIMYHPITADNDDEYVELHNRGTVTADLGHWRFTSGIAFVFPAGTQLAPGAYLVVARDTAHVIAKHPQLNSTNTLGNYSGSLSDRGERVVLSKPDDPLFPNQDFVVVDTVAYTDGEDWGRWADGGGSSLELMDPHADNRRASSWADSDETQKAPWTTVAVTGIVEAALEQITPTLPNMEYDEFHAFALQAGEYLVDDVLVRRTDGTTLAEDDFASGPGNWELLGTHETSYLETTGGVTGSPCLHIVASDPGDTIYDSAQRPPPYYNRVVKPLSPWATLGAETVMRARVRWQCGYPYLILCVKGFALEASGRLAVPGNLGTPGMPNSRLRSKTGPAIETVAHEPVLPQDGDAPTVRCRVTDVNAVAAVRCRYRIDPSPAATTLAMRDDGSGGDVLAGDGIYSTTIPAQAAGTMVAFSIEAIDDSFATNRFPVDAPAREALIRFGDPIDDGDLTTYRLWMTEANITEWTSRHTHNNTPLDATIVYGNDRCIYTGTARYRGNWRRFDGPVTTDPCGFVLSVPRGERLLGSGEIKIDMPGQNGADGTLQREVVGYRLIRGAGLPGSRARYVRMRVNHRDKGVLYDFQTPARSFAESWFTDDNDPLVWRIMHNNGLDHYPNTLGERKQPRYRASWERRDTNRASDDFSSIYALTDVVNLADDGAYAANVQAAIDMARWLGAVALNHVIVNSDAFGYGFRHNAYLYAPLKEGAVPFVYDLDNGLSGGDSTSSGLFNTDKYTTRMLRFPRFRRIYWRNLHACVHGPLRADRIEPFMDAWYDVFTTNGLSPTAPGSLETWLANRRAYILGQLNGVSAAFAITSNGGNDFSTNQAIVTIEGTAPVTVDTLRVNGKPAEVTYTSETEWHIAMGLGAGANPLLIEALDPSGNPLATDSIAITVTGQAVSPAGYLVINEIMYNPPVTDAEFVELHNRSDTRTFDLGGLRLNGVGHTFPHGTLIEPGGYVAIAENLPIYAKTYTNAEVVVGDYPGALDNGGETISLWMPATPATPGAFANTDATNTNWWVTIDEVRYDDNAPWPSQADGGGPSLQLVDATRDNNRIGNWAAAPTTTEPEWTYVAVTGLTAASGVNGAVFNLYLDGAGTVYIDDVRLVEGQDPAAGVNLLANGDFESPLAGSWTLSGNHAASSVSNGPVRSGMGSLCLTASGAGNSGRFANSVNQANLGLSESTSYSAGLWYYPPGENLSLTMELTQSDILSSGNVRFEPRELNVCTPGQPNNVEAALPAFPDLRINEIMPSNLVAFADNHGEYAPWIEIYNGGHGTIDLGNGFRLSNDAGNPAAWAFPNGQTIGSNAHLLVWADGETHETAPGIPHASFRLNSSTGCVVLAWETLGRVLVLDALPYGIVSPDHSYGSFPEGVPYAWQVFHTPTPGAANTPASQTTTVCINEWMAKNDTTLQDPADGDFEDWFELFNYGPKAVSLGGYSLADVSASSNRFAIPGGVTLKAGDYLLAWADDETSQNAPDRDLHVNFKLTADGDSIALFAPDGSLVDAVTFGAQLGDRGEGRWPDGNPRVHVMAPPTPGEPNRVLLIATLTGSRPRSITLTWDGDPGAVYRLDWRDDLGAGSWTPLGIVTAQTASVALTDTNAPPNARRFYRLVREE